jgi:hypothetical protein
MSQRPEVRERRREWNSRHEVQERGRKLAAQRRYKAAVALQTLALLGYSTTELDDWVAKHAH